MKLKKIKFDRSFSNNIPIFFLITLLGTVACDDVLENGKLYQIGEGHTMMNIDEADFKADSTKQLFLEGFKYYTQEKFVRARFLYLKAYHQDTTNYVLLNALANLECQLENYEDAEDYYGKAVVTVPEGPETFLNYGRCLMNQEKYDQAIKVMSPKYKAYLGVELNESRQLVFFSLCYNLAVCNHELQRCTEALKFVHIVLKYCEQEDIRSTFIELKKGIEKDCDPDARLS